MNYFKELKVWQKAIDLVTETYLITKSFPKEEIYGITSQIRRSSISIPSNIAEGCGRKTDKDFSNFLGISLGSAFEFETQLIICKNLEFINNDDFAKLESEIQHIQNMIIKLIKSLEDKK
jgi:four helix bundle protein